MKNNLGMVMLGTMGNFKSMYANRISFAFDFKGPSLITDTACSASLVAFNLAMNDLRLGEFYVLCQRELWVSLVPRISEGSATCFHVV